MTVLRIATLPGSLRTGSFNRRLLKLAESLLADKGLEIDPLDLRDFPLPPYDGDREEQQGLPAEAWTLKARLAASHGVLIACPEYNYGISGMFKNVIDWTSRGGSNPWTGKIVGLMSASTGPIGGWRIMPQLRGTLSALGSIVVPKQVNVRDAKKVWDAEGNLLDEKLPAVVQTMLDDFLLITERLKTNP
jgi:chromate reductase, NAD(P)H dehydrogenase (quinone)